MHMLLQREASVSKGCLQRAKVATLCKKGSADHTADIVPQSRRHSNQIVFSGELTDQWVASMPLQVAHAMDGLSQTERKLEEALTLLIMTAHLRGVPFSLVSVQTRVISRCHHAPKVWRSDANFVASNSPSNSANEASSWLASPQESP